MVLGLRSTCLALFIVALLVAPLLQAQTESLPLMWSRSASNTVTAYNYADAPINRFQDNGYYWSVFSDAQSIWHVQRATSAAALDSASDYVSFNSTVFPKRVGDELYWVNGVWADTSTNPHTWHALVHVEFNYGNNPSGGPNGNVDHFRRIMTATSTDQGASWTLGQDVVTSDHGTDITDTTDFPTSYFNFGPGDEHLFIDVANGFFYMNYQVSWVEKSTFARYEAERIARCPISAKMEPGCWVKWYAGSWSQPGLGGHDSDIMTNTDNAVIFYSQPLSQYIMIGNGNNNQTIQTTTSLATQSWTAQGAFSSNAAEFYPSVQDPVTGDPYTVTSNSVKLYWSQAYVNSTAAEYFTVDLSPGTTMVTEYNAPTYPSESVPDSNPGWDSNCVVAGCSQTNLVSNPGFETGNLSSWRNDGATVQPVGDQHSGSYAAESSGPYSGVDQTVSSLASNKSYLLLAWARTTSSDSASYIGVKSYGGAEIYSSTNSNTYVPLQTTFVVGSGNHSANVYLWQKEASGTVFADDFVVSPNLIANPNFETGDLTSWTSTGSGANVVSDGGANSGAYEVRSAGALSGVAQIITGLAPNTSYTLTALVKTTDSASQGAIGVKNFGGDERAEYVNSQDYSWVLITFTTGPTNTSAQIYLWQTAGSGQAYADDFALFQVNR